MDEDEISYKYLRKIQQNEKSSPILSKISSNFYVDLKKYIESLKERLSSVDTPQKKVLLTDEVDNTIKISTNIYEQREKKILLAVSTKARGGNPDLKNMLDIEKNLFDSLLAMMKNTRNQFLEGKPLKNKDIVVDENNKEIVEETISANKENTNPIIRVKEDIPEFIGTNEKKYNLRKNDILTISEDMSEILEKRGVVEKIKK